MSADVRPAGLDTFIRCATPGCDVMVYAPRDSEPRCVTNGHGAAPNFYEYREPDEFGNPPESE